MAYKEFELDGRARAYVLAELRSGNLLAREVAESVDLNAGRIVTMLPSTVSYESAHEFKYGGKLPTPPRSTWKKIPGGIAIPTPSMGSWIEQVISGYLRLGNGNAAILEDYMARPSYLSKWTLKSRVFIVKDEVYHILVDSDADASSLISNTISEASSAMPSEICVLTKSIGYEPKVGSEILQLTAKNLKQFALATTAVLARAYDHESFILWTKQS